MQIFKEDTSKSPEPQEVPVKKRAPRNNREIICNICGKIVKVNRYIVDKDRYTCGKCKDIVIESKKREEKIKKDLERRKREFQLQIAIAEAKKENRKHEANDKRDSRKAS
jgi:hypothetical protein